MNKTIKLAVAGAVLSAASMANAGIIIPAGEWTLDVNGNVNMYVSRTSTDDANTVAGGLASTNEAVTGEDEAYSLGTGLLPAWLGFTGTTRQNDLDVSFTISFQPNASDNQSSGMGDTATPLNRQAFLTFGDASWGSVKVGKDLGIFAGDAILNDMTLLGVGAGGSRSGGPTTLGGIGTGYIYPAWKGQIAYTTPNMNGFQATFGITNPQQGTNTVVADPIAGLAVETPNATNQERYGFEAKASYALNLGSTTGKVWVSGISNEVSIGAVDHDVTVMDIGINLNSGNAGLTAYYYSGEGAGLTTNVNGASGANAAGVERDSDGGYVQGTYVIPTGTKLGVAYGRSSLDKINAADTAILDQNERWTVGAYHPLTKHLNLVAEFNSVESKDHQGDKAESDSISLGAILFF